LNGNRIEDLKFLAYILNEDETNGTEDKPLIAYECTADYNKASQDNTVGNHEYHVQSSGFAAFETKWLSNDGSNDPEIVCPWELIPHDLESDSPMPPQLSEEDTNQLNDILEDIERKPDVKLFFSNAVDTNHYADYLNYVVVPMDISRIRLRLKNSYYTNLLSVVTDVMLMKENCIKYNKIDSHVVEVAGMMCNDFQRLFDERMDKTAGEHSLKRSQHVQNGLRTTSRTDGQSVLQSLDSIQKPIILRRCVNNNEINDLSSASSRSHIQQLTVQDENISNQEYGIDSAEENSCSDQEFDSESDDAEEQESDNVKQRKSNRIRLKIVANHSKEEAHQTTKIAESDSKDSFFSDSAENKTSTRNASLPRRSSPRNKKSQEIKYDSSSQYDSDLSEQLSASEIISKKRPHESYSEVLDNSSVNSTPSESYESESSGYVPGVGRKSKMSRKKSKVSSDTMPKSNSQYLPDIPIWPSRMIAKHDLEAFCLCIMKELEDQDNQQLFAMPVYEQYPQMADDYLNSIRTPMDFRTIKFSRIGHYKTIKCLQDDLILTFRNCCNFNGEQHMLWRYSVNLWKDLTDTFKKVCKEKGIELPRRW